MLENRRGGWRAEVRQNDHAVFAIGLESELGVDPRGTAPATDETSPPDELFANGVPIRGPPRRELRAGDIVIETGALSAILL